MADEIQTEVNNLSLNVSMRAIRENNPNWSRDMVNDYFYIRQTFEVLAQAGDVSVADVLKNAETIVELEGLTAQNRARAKALSKALAANLELTTELSQLTARFKRQQKEIQALRPLIADTGPSVARFKQQQKEIQALKQLVAEVPSVAQIRSLKNEIKALRSLVNAH